VGVLIAQDAECRSMAGNRMAYELLRLAPGTMIPSSMPGELRKSWREVREGKDIQRKNYHEHRRAFGLPVHNYEF